MKSLPQSLKQIKSKIQLMLTMTFILIASIWFALHSQPVQTIRRVVPDQVIQLISLDRALDLSLAYGDGRRVDWGMVN